MRATVAVAVACLSVVSITSASDVQAAIRQPTNIAAQGLAPALRRLAKDRNVQFVYRSDLVEDQHTGGATGNLTFEEALNQLLVGTGLTYRYLESNAITIVPLGLEKSDNSSPASANSENRRNREEGTESKSLRDRFRLAQVDQGTSENASSVENPRRDSDEKSAKLEEITVTAQKREERLQDVPVPVTALNASTLAERSQDRLQDYFSTVPGLNLNLADSGQQTIAIRGVNTGVLGNPTVGVTVDDTPYGSSTLLGNGNSLYPDIDPSDLERIEVLRGPQGTLYGASSIGGLIKFVTKEPSTDQFSGHLQVLGDSIEHGGVGYGLRGSANVPVTDDFAVRASVFKRIDPGYVDNVTTGQHGVNRLSVYGGRLSALWQPSEIVSVKFGALLQNTEGDGSGTVDTDSSLQPTYGYLKQARLQGTEGYSSKVSLYTATLTAKLPDLEITSISGYGIDTYSQLADFSPSAGTLAEAYFEVPGASASDYYQTRKFSQELRLSATSGQLLDWLAGAFYTRESTAANLAILANDAPSGLRVGSIIDYNFPTVVSEYALFGDLTIHFTDRADVQVGGRESRYRQKYDETDSGAAVPALYFGNPSPLVNATERTNGNAFTYLLTPRVKLSSDLMLYARFTSGYRMGGNNVNGVVAGVPTSYKPDKTNNYEVGIKGNLLDRLLSVDASVYYVDWKKIQLSLVNSVNYSGYNANGGGAKSQGVELSIEARPFTGLTISSWVAYDDAELTQDLPPAVCCVAIGHAGDRLPYSSRLSGNLSVNQDIGLTSGWTGSAGGSLTYVGGRYSDFTTDLALPRVYLPAYTGIDLRIGARRESWAVNLFVNNIANRRGVVGGGRLLQTGYYAVYLQPRTLGLSVSKAF